MSIVDSLSAINSAPVINSPLVPKPKIDDGYYIPGVIISLINDGPATFATRKLLGSIRDTGSKILPFIMEASTPPTMRADLIPIFGHTFAKDVTWTWPTSVNQDGIDLKTGLYKKSYNAVNWHRVMACMVSHMRAWSYCEKLNVPICVLESDAIFCKTFKYRYLTENGFTNGVVGLNNPLGATRKARVFHARVCENIGAGVFPVPIVDESNDPPYPSGIAGNSAYVVTPIAARALLAKTKEIGLWPNDALMCRQLFPWIHISKPYYTNLQGTKSTTTGVM